MKKAKLTLTLNKETVANLNNNEMNDVKGGTEKNTPGCPTMCTNCCIIVGPTAGGWIRPTCEC